jgi:uncharacterized protein
MNSAARDVRLARSAANSLRRASPVGPCASSAQFSRIRATTRDVHVAALWRYPVKSMGGETLQECELTTGGIPGDRAVHVEDARGRVVTSRSRPKLLLHRVRLGEDGEPLVDGRPWRADEVARAVREAAGDGARLVAYTGLERFDVLPLLVATDGATAALGFDARRFRPNLIVGGVEGFAERRWEGRRLSVGAAVIAAVDLRQRCIMTTFDPDTAEQDVEVLRTIRHRLDGTLGLNCRVEKPGRVRVGDPVSLLE